jgi:flagellar basal body P-ring protein FlgI
MIEKQIEYKEKDGEKAMMVGLYNKKDKVYEFIFTEDEIKEVLKDLGVKFKIRTLK